MRPVLFLIPKFSLTVYLVLLGAEFLLFSMLFFLLRKRYDEVKKLKSDLAGYFIFFLVIITLLFFFGPFPVRTYGVAVAIGFLFAIMVASRLAGKINVSSSPIFDMGIYILAGVIAGSRIFYVIFYDWSYFIENPLRLFAIWEGGLVFYGGLLGGILCGVYYIRKAGLDILKIADVVGVALGVGYFFGRLGCLGYGCCYGKTAPDSFPFRIHFPAIGSPLTGYTPAFADHLEQGLVTVHSGHSLFVYPVQIMESLSGLFLFLLLLFLYQKRKFNGQIAAFFLLFYSVLRFAIEFLRTEPVFLGITTSQWIGVLVFLSGLFLYKWARKKNLSGA
ncbi:MAG: prolipoprotein diacylglyceryl transferase [bacterium]|nr:prolipoprotein diacylglyceryl transferase [bacterium]